MLATAGIDAGAATTKAVVLSEENVILGKGVVPSRADLARAAQEAFLLALEQAKLSREDVGYVVSTGFGRYMVPFRDIQVTDLTAHAQGALYYFPNTRSVLDIGAQSTRVSRIEPWGRVKVFRLNAKCAAGAGTFLVRVAKYLEVHLEDLGPLSLGSEQPQPISNVCAVLAETEIINHLTAGVKLEDILKGAMLAIADQGLGLLKRVGVEPEVTLTGGVSKNVGMVAALRQQLGQPINVSANGEEGSFFAGALGAGLLGLMRLRKLRGEG
jgi:predicted CoA-substrate-specific enzyme activase